MKALSIMQPWAWCIVRPDVTNRSKRIEMALEGGIFKDIENRNWKSWNPGLAYRGKFLVHAGQKVDGGVRGYEELRQSIADTMGVWTPDYDDLQRGGIIGMSEVLEVVTQHWSRWFTGEHGLVLGRSRPLPFMPLKGQLGFFEVPAEVVARYRAA
jgi:hypothetical protein